MTSMKTPAILLVLLLFAVDAAAQTPAGVSAGPPQIAQGGPSAPAGSAAVGATLPAANTGGSSATMAAIGLTVAAFGAAAFGSYNTTPSNH
jgi:hypothetical protein